MFALRNKGQVVLRLLLTTDCFLSGCMPYGKEIWTVKEQDVIRIEKNDIRIVR